MATALRDDRHDHSLLTDLVGMVLGAALIVLLLAATLAGVGLVVVHWAESLGG